MKRCLGFPWCREIVADDHITCLKCWRLIPHRLRNEVKAVVKRWAGTKLYHDTVGRAENILHKRLIIRRRYLDKVAENRKLFTIVG